jgi:predicted HD phosphohydrolase
MEQVKFRQMKDGTKEEFAFLTAHETQYAAGTADRLIAALVELDTSLSGSQVTRLGHSLQSATRAWRDGTNPALIPTMTRCPSPFLRPWCTRSLPATP